MDNLHTEEEKRRRKEEFMYCLSQLYRRHSDGESESEKARKKAPTSKKSIAEAEAEKLGWKPGIEPRTTALCYLFATTSAIFYSKYFGSMLGAVHGLFEVGNGLFPLYQPQRFNFRKTSGIEPGSNG